MKNATLAVIMVIITICDYIAYVPQIVKMVKTKKSDDISIGSWVLWFLTSVLGVIYGIILKRPEFLISEVSILILNIVIIVLSIKFKTKNKIITLCNCEVVFNDEWFLLNTIVDNLETSDSTIKGIINNCETIAVLNNITQSANPNIKEETRNLAKNKLKLLQG